MFGAVCPQWCCPPQLSSHPAFGCLALERPKLGGPGSLKGKAALFTRLQPGRRRPGLGASSRALQRESLSEGPGAPEGSAQDPQPLRGPRADLLASGRLCAHSWVRNGVSLFAWRLCVKLLKLKVWLKGPMEGEVSLGSWFPNRVSWAL